MMTFPVWTYWENLPGRRIPPYLALCLEILRRRCPGAEVHLVGPDDLPELIGDLPVDFERLRVRGRSGPPIAQKADYIRIALLQKYGGLWLDVDVIALCDIAAFAEEALKEHEFVCMRKDLTSGHVTNSFLATRPGGAVVTEMLSQITEALVSAERENVELDWLAMGSAILTPIVERHADTTRFVPEEDIHPIHFLESDVFFRRDDLVDHIDLVDPGAKLAMLYNARFTEADRALPRRELLGSNTLIGQLFRQALPDEASRLEPAAVPPVRRFTPADIDLVFTTIDRHQSAFDFIEFDPAGDRNRHPHHRSRATRGDARRSCSVEKLLQDTRCPATLRGRGLRIVALPQRLHRRDRPPPRVPLR